MNDKHNHFFFRYNTRYSLKEYTGIPWAENTVDLVVAGDPGVQVTGIATTFTATMEVLKKAVDRNINFIITHEPTFYNHLDETGQFDGDQVYETKMQFIESNGLVVWRFHDHIHRMKPDGIVEGMVKGLDWEKYLVAGEDRVFDLPSTSLRKLGQELGDHYGISTLRVIGDPDLEVSRAGLVVGCPGSNAHYIMLQRDDIDIIIIGEAREWETVEYVRDASLQGLKKGMIILGHVISEEDGMKYLADDLKEVIPGIPVQFIPAGNPFWTVK